MDNKNFYEQYQWHSIDKVGLDSKIKRIIGTIPNDVVSVIDIGCGNGVITNELAGKYDVTGVDRSRRALESLKTKSVCASSDAIPLPDLSFDLVFSSEMLEHLDNQTLSASIDEMKRLSKKYILITVPNAENLNKFLVKCPNCKFRFNHSYHLQSLDITRLTKLFTGFTVKNYFEYGPGVRTYNNMLSRWKVRMCPSASWFPYFANHTKDEQNMCPSCEHVFYHNYRFHLLAFGIDVLNVLISPKRPYWIFMLFEKDAVK
jgi:SAM-dependent methyltransferase